jgi:hypothetical protein
MEPLGFQLPNFTYQSRDCVDSAPVVNGLFNDGQTITNFAGDVDCTTINVNLNFNLEINNITNGSIDKSSVNATGIGNDAEKHGGKGPAGNSLQTLPPADVPIPSQYPRVD